MIMFSNSPSAHQAQTIPKTQGGTDFRGKDGVVMAARPGALMLPLKLTFRDHAIPIKIDADGVPWFLASAICDALGYRDAASAIKSHVALEDVRQMEDDDAAGQGLTQKFVNETGAYGLMSGRLGPNARALKDWMRKTMPGLGVRTRRAASDFAFHAFFDGPTHIAAARPSPSIAASHDVDYVVARIPREAPLTTSDDVIDLDSDAWIEKVFASATQSQLKRVLRAVAARLV